MMRSGKENKEKYTRQHIDIYIQLCMCMYDGEERIVSLTDIII